MSAVALITGQLLDELEYDGIILATMALALNREARFDDDRAALRAALMAIHEHVNLMLAIFKQLEESGP
jgi:hypothetical protein